MSFQKTLNRDLPRGVAGDFASVNPRGSMLAGEGALRTAELITVGKFAFADTDTGLVHQAHADGYRAGFVHRNNNATILGNEEASMGILSGRQCTLYTTGDFYTIFDADVTVDQLVFANKADGKPVGADAVSAETVATKFIVAENATAGQLCRITVLG